jgi:RimJ/RimL family protein N-acetyltransferase
MTSEHIETLYPKVSGDENAHLWDYMLGGPYDDISEFRAAMEAQRASQDSFFFAIIPADQPTTPDGADNIVGCARYMHMDVDNRSLEVGSVLFTAQLQRTPAATEAMYLMAKHAFEDLGYRRYEWKCNALNTRSRRAALRLGFKFEGTFRQHMIVKGRNRDTEWFSMIDGEWPGIKNAFDAWLDPANFDEQGLQRERLDTTRGK